MNGQRPSRAQFGHRYVRSWPRADATVSRGSWGTPAPRGIPYQRDQYSAREAEVLASSIEQAKLPPNIRASLRTETDLTEITQKTSCSLKVGGVETFGKPVVNRL